MRWGPQRDTLNLMKTTARYEVVSGTRINPGSVLKTFQGEYKCGGPATACLRWFAKHSKTGPMFFRKAA